MKKILITGASGFIGSFIAEEALKRGFETWAAVRKGSSRRYLTDSRLHFIELDLGDPGDLRDKLTGSGFNYVVHAAGATKCLRKDDFYRVNTDGTANLAAAVAETCPGLERFVFISSLSVYGPVRDDSPGTPITDGDTPRPTTAYGESKLMAEDALDGIRGLHFSVLRPTGVYGPREKDYFMMAKSIKSHVDFAAGLKPRARGCPVRFLPACRRRRTRRQRPIPATGKRGRRKEPGIRTQLPHLRHRILSSRCCGSRALCMWMLWGPPWDAAPQSWRRCCWDWR